MTLILLVSLLYFYIFNFVFVLPELDRKTKKFKVENNLVKRKHLEGTCALRSLTWFAS